MAGRRLGATALIVASALTALPAGALGQPIDCDAPDIERIVAELAVAQAAVTAGNRVALMAAVESAREQLDAIAIACGTGGPGLSPSPDPIGSLPPVALDVSLQADTFRLRHPSTLVPLEADLLRSVAGEHAAEAVSLGDSAPTGDLVQGTLDTLLPESARILSVAVGDPAATLATIGIFDADETAPGTPSAAMTELAARLETDGPTGPTRITHGAIGDLAFADGTTGATLDIGFATVEGDRPIAEGRFLVRVLPDGSWAVAVAIVPPGALGGFGPVAVAVVESIAAG